MNKKLIYTGIWLCLGGLGLTNSAWADSDSANKQSVKKCWFGAEDADVLLTKEQPYGHVNAGPNLSDPLDDFYEICDTANYDPSGCDPVGPIPLAIDTTTSGTGTPFIDPVTGEPVPVLDQNGQPVIDPITLLPLPKLYTYTGLNIMGTNRADGIIGTSGDDQICGQSGNDTIDAGEGDDDAQGGNGNDIIIGGPGNDDVYGGNGSDWLYGYDQDASDDLVDVEDSNGDLVITDADILDDEDLLEGGNGTDAMSGGPNHDKMYGGNANDALTGDGGNDELDGGNGKDVLNGSDGADAISIGKGKDSCIDPDAGDCPAIQPKGKNGGNKGGKK
jgi:hypothetical protein